MEICYWTPNAAGGAGKYEYYLPREVEDFGIMTKVLARPKGFLGNPITLKLFYKSRGDIVHVTSQTLSIYSYPKPKNFVVTVHDIYSRHKSLVSRLKRTLLKKGLKRVDRIIAASKFTKEEIMAQIEMEEVMIEVIYMGVDHSLYKPIDKEISKKECGLNLEEKHILVVASNASHKRMDITLAVFKEIRKIRKDVKLLKCGYGTRLKGEGIINAGFIPEEKMPFVYNAADLLFHPSEYEGFGMPLLEAMSCGTPIVTSNKASIPEVVKNCGELVDLDSNECVEQFTEKVLACFDKGKSYEAIERSKKFTWEKTAKETIKVYEQLL